MCLRVEDLLWLSSTKPLLLLSQSHYFFFASLTVPLLWWKIRHKKEERHWLCNLFWVHVHFEIQNLRRTSWVFNFVLKNIQNLKALWNMKYYVITMSITIIDQIGFVWTYRQPSMFWHSNNITYHLFDTTKSIQILRIQELVHFRWQRLIFTQVHEVAWVRIRETIKHVIQQ